MVRLGRSLFCLLFLCTVMAIQCRHPVEPVLTPNFVASLSSRVRATEPLEIREFRKSCQREPGCRWRCGDENYANCKCECGSQNKRNNISSSSKN